MNDVARYYWDMGETERARFAKLDPQGHAKAKRIADRERGRRDFWYFLTEIVGNPVVTERIHRPLCKWLEPQSWEKRKKLLLWPRGHIKSNVCTCAWTLWMLVRDQNLRIVIASHKAPDARKWVKLIKRHMVSGRIPELYPEVQPEVNEATGRQVTWSGEALMLRRSRDLTECSVETCSLDALVTGRHYDIGILDDIVTEKNVAGPELIQATREFVALFDSLLDPGALQLMAGTRYDWSDQYGYTKDTPTVAEEWDIWELNAVSEERVIDEYVRGEREWTRGDDEKYLVYPERFTLAPKDYVHPTDKTKNRKSLVATCRTQGTYVFYCQYMNNPIDPRNRVFRKEDILEVDELPPGVKLNFFRVLDMSTEKETRDSYTVVVTGAVAPGSVIYITDVEWGTYAPSWVVKNLIDGQQIDVSRRPLRVGLAPGPYEKALKPWLDRAQVEHNTFVPLQFLPGAEAQKTKEQRIRGLQPWVEARKLVFLRGCRNKERAITELVKFPRYNLRDIADSMAIIPHIMFTTEADNPNKDDLINGWIERRAVPIGLFDRRELGSEYDGVLGNEYARDPGTGGLAFIPANTDW